MTDPRLVGTHHHLADNIFDLTETIRAVASGVAASGIFLPPGGSIGQALLKNSGIDGDAAWHDIEDMATAETDDTFVLKPDGIGGVVFAATSGIIAAYDTVQDEGSPLTQRSTINFVGAGVSAADSGGVTTVTISGGSGPATLRFYVPFGSGEESFTP